MKEKRIKCKIIIWTLIIGFSCLSSTVLAQGISAIWANEGGDKVTQEELRVGSPNGRPVINHIWDGSTVTIKGAKNEVVNFNIVIEAATTQASDVSVSFNTLNGPGGAVIQSSSATGDGVFNWVGREIELFYIRYLQIKGLSILGYENSYDERHIPERFRRAGYNSNTGGASGNWTDRPDHDTYYPDIAVPLELVPTFNIEATKNQSIWVDIYIPDDAAVGTYTGTITITESGYTPKTIPIELEVYNFSLPDMPTAKTMLYYSPSNVNERHLGAAWIDPPNEELAEEIQNKYWLMGHRHKISLISEESWINSDYTEEDHPSTFFAEKLSGSFFTSTNGYDGPGVNIGNNVFSIGTYGSWQGSWGTTESDIQTHSNNWVNWFDSNSPETEYFLYLIDESDDYAQIETWAQYLDNNPGSGSRLRSFATIDLPSAAANTPTLKIPTSTACFGIPDDWENSANTYSNDSERGFYLYNGSRPAAGCFMTDDDGVALRANAWIQYKKHINRWFYWESTYYEDFQGGTGKIDVFNSAHTFGSFSSTDNVIGETGWNYSNGDGVMFYPGTDELFPASSYDVNGPFASLRLKYWRRGLQDHDYLTLAAEIDPEAVQDIVDEIIPEVVWEVGVEELSDPTWVLTDISWSTNPDVWDEARESLATIISSGTTSINNVENVSGNVSLLQNYPNPFSLNTTINYTISDSNIGKSKQPKVQVIIYDLSGREVITLVDKQLSAGTYIVDWDGKNFTGQQVSEGVYYCRLKIGNEKVQSKKIIHVK